MTVDGLNAAVEKDVVLFCQVAKEDTILDIQVVSKHLGYRFL